MSEFEIKREDVQLTIHSASELIAELDKESEDYLFRVQAIIKRLLHVEKASVYQRIVLYGKRNPSFAINEFAATQFKTHCEMADKSDEEIITWDVGSHKFLQEIKKEK